MPSEYEDKYLLLRDENTALKKKKNEQEATIKRMFTKLAMIEEKLTKSRQGEAKNNQDEPDTGGNKAAVVPVRRDLDAEKFIAALKSENVALRKKNQTLMEKNRWLEEQFRQSSSLKRPGSAAATTRPSTQKRPAVRNAAASRTGFAGSTLEKQADSARKLHRDTFSGELEVALKKRLVVAEKQLMKLQKENEQLRTSSSRLQLKPRRDNNEDSEPSDEEDGDSDANNKESTNLELDQMKRELRDRQAQLAILNARYENLESNALAEREIQEKTLSQMEQMNRQVHKLRTQLQDANMEKEELEIRIMKAGDQEKDFALLREQNRRLEERMTSLCESPFINDAFQRKERIDKLFDLEKLTQEQKATIAHMTEENQKLQGAIRELQESLKQMKHSKDRVEQDLERMAHHLMEERNARSLEAVKPPTGSAPAPRPEPVIIVRPRTPDTQHQAPEKRDACSSPVNNASPAKSSARSITMAGGIVTHKYGDFPPTSNFLDTTGGEDNSVKHLRNRVHVLQIAHLKSMQELERCEKMLQAQTNINRELALEIEELTTSKISSSNQLQRRMKELELLCEERHQRIITRQAEIKQLKYAREKLLLKARDAGDACSEDSRSDDEMSEAASLSESLILAARGLAPGEQLLELGIVGGNFDSNVVGINSSTFVLCDFFDFESQSTPLLMGSRPEYNLSATFKVTVDGFFLRYLATEAIVLEVHQAVRGDFKLIGKSSIRLAKLLQSKGVVKEPLLTINSTSCINESGATVIGTLNVVLRLSTPISEVWQVHLRSYPQDLKLLSATSKRADPAISRDVLCDDDITAAGRLTNELQITVFGCRNLRSYGKRTDSAITRLPSSYVHYQLLGFPDVFTNIVPESASPGYDLSCSQQAFVLAVDACLLRFLSKFRFWITVFDDQAELDEGAHEDGMVGRCGLTLSDLVNGENIRGWFPLKDQNDKHAGDISVLIQWKDPFQVLQMTSSQRTRGVNGRPIDVYSLDFDQQHALLAMFSADMDGRVNYRQFLHYAVPSEELELLVAKLKERFEHAIDSELVTSVQDALTSGADVKQRKRMHLPMRLFVRAGEKYGVFLSDAEQQILQVTFGVTSPATETIPKNKTVSGMENEPETLIELNYLLLHINPRLSCAERLLGHKIRQTMRVYAQEQRRRKPALVVPANKPFEKFDDAKCGKITRSAFRKCLSALGFDLMNVESEYRELVRSHINQPISDDPHIDLVPIDASLSSQAGIDLDEDVLENATQVSHQPKRLSCGSDKTTTSTVNQRDQPTRDPPERFVTPLPASSEFQRRKQAFMDRMKAIVSASSKNLVYEQVEKKLHEQRAQEKKQQTTLLPRQELLQEHLKRLHVPQNIHHEAARTLQRQYRQYKEQQQEQVYRHSCSSIVAADLELQRILRKWTIADLCNLEDIIVNEIERDAPEAKRTRLLSKKQLSYFLSKVSRIALPPALLWQLMDYFAVKESGMVVYRRLLNFIFSTCTAADEKDHDKKMRLSVMDRLLLDVGLAHHMFASAGDMTHMGVISIGKFRECLTRLGVRLSPKDFHLITVLFDVNGFEILYHALVHSLAQLPNCQQLAKAIERCRAFGIPSLREKLLTCTSSDDGRMPREEFLRVLMQQNTEVEQFRPEDAGMLFQMIVGVDDCTMGMPIEELCIRLEAAARYRRKSVYDEWDKYDIHQLQRLAWNCRNLLCGSYIDLKSAFERFDWQETGSVSLIEFVSIARRNGFTMFTENQLRGVAKQFGAKTNGSFGIKYKEFLDWTTPPPPVDMDTVEAKLRKFAQTKAETLPTRQLSDILASWNMIFVAKAESRPGGINRSQFVTICKTQLGLPLDENEMRALLYTYDPQLEDRIDYSAFLWLNWREAAISRTEKRKVANATAQAKGSTKNTRKEDIATVAAVPGTQALAPKASISHLSDFLDWCEDRGVDLRGELEAYDSAYTGFVTATELKQTLFRLGISKMDSSSFAEAAIGQLLRQFRHPERTDAVNYTKMISQAAKLDWFGADSQWHDQISELLRSRIRSKANLTGKIDHSDKANYVRFDAAFSHFDRERKGFLTAENIRNGLLALNYQPTPAQLGLLMAQMRIFRHDGGGLSRTEFDSFVLDPYGFRLMNKLSKQLYSVVEPRSHDTMPRVAYLSRLLMEYGGSNDASSLPANTFWTQLERALERQVTDVEKLRLQHLFDVNRDSQIAYKLFLKVMSQWRTPVSGPVLLAESKSTEERPPVPLEKQPIAQVQHKTEQPSCSRDAVLHSLYNQMSSIDFNSQLDIVEEYLRENDRKHTGSIKTKQLKRVFEQIGLSLSVDAFTSLQMFYPGIDSPNKTQEQGELVAYEKLLLALVALHERSHDHESK